MVTIKDRAEPYTKNQLKAALRARNMEDTIMKPSEPNDSGCEGSNKYIWEEHRESEGEDGAKTTPPCHHLCESSSTQNNAPAQEDNPSN